jgi:phosphoglycerate dehydrogenase-like enzyme
VVDVLVLGASPDSPPPGIPEVRTGARYRFADDAAGLRAALPTTDAIFHWSNRTALLRAAWPSAARLRWIHATGVGVEWSIFPELIDSQVQLTNCRGVFDSTMPEYALALLLALAKDIPATLAAQTRRLWHHRPLAPLTGRRAVVVGAGTIGRATARLLIAIGMEVVLVGRTARPDPEFGRIAGSTDLGTVLPGAQALLVVLPATSETRGLIGRDELAALPPSAWLVNIGRGTTVDEGALTDALRSGSLAGAALDVFEREPLPADSRLWELPNVIVSPHIGGDVDGWLSWFSDAFLENLERFIAHRPLENVVDPRLGYVPTRTAADAVAAGPAGL